MLSFQNISPPLHWWYCRNEVPESCFATRQQQPAAGCLWSVWPPPPDGGLAAWQPVGNTDQPPSCPELCPFYSLPITFTYQGPAAKPDKPPAPHVCRLPWRTGKVTDAQRTKRSAFAARWRLCRCFAQTAPSAARSREAPRRSLLIRALINNSPAHQPL